MWPFSRRKPVVTPEPRLDRVAALRRERDELRRHLAEQRLERGNKVLRESLGMGDEFGWSRRWEDWLARFNQGDWFLPFGVQYDHRRGGNWPYYQNDEELGFLRSLGRISVGRNIYARGLLEGVTSYVVGKGFEVRATARGKEVPAEAVRRVQMVIEEFVKRTGFGLRTQEAFKRSRRDGEVFWRVFSNSDGYSTIRFVWPEQVRTPAGQTNDETKTFGIETAPGDTETVLGYWLNPANAVNQLDPEFIPGDTMFHLKCNVDAGVKRGMPDYAFSMREIADAALKLARNMGLGAAVREAFAYGRQHKGGIPMEAIEDFVEGQADYTMPRPYSPSSTRDTTVIEPGEVFDVPETMEYVPPPGNAAAGQDVQIHDVLLHAMAMYWNAPAWLASSNPNDMGAYTASLVAESPFTIRIDRERELYIGFVSRTLVAVLRAAEESGRLAPDDLDLVEVQIEGNTIVPRDKAVDATTDQTYLAMGILSPQTISQRLGLDFEQEQTNILAAKKRGGPEAMAEPDKLASAGGLIDPAPMAIDPVQSKPVGVGGQSVGPSADANGKHESLALGIRDELIEAFRRVVPATPPAIEINVPPANVSVDVPAQAAPVVIVEGDRPARPSPRMVVHKIHRNADHQIIRMECEDPQGRFEYIYERDDEGRLLSMREIR